jgi:hypothetical protein
MGEDIKSAPLKDNTAIKGQFPHDNHPVLAQKAEGLPVLESRETYAKVHSAGTRTHISIASGKQEVPH